MCARCRLFFVPQVLCFSSGDGMYVVYQVVVGVSDQKGEGGGVCDWLTTRGVAQMLRTQGAPFLFNPQHRQCRAKGSGMEVTRHIHTQGRPQATVPYKEKTVDNQCLPSKCLRFACLLRVEGGGRQGWRWVQDQEHRVVAGHLLGNELRRELAQVLVVPNVASGHGGGRDARDGGQGQGQVSGAGASIDEQHRNGTRGQGLVPAQGRTGERGKPDGGGWGCSRSLARLTSPHPYMHEA